MSSPVLLLRTASGRYDRIAIDGAGVGIGRDPANSICLFDPEVSREHARIRAVDGRLELVDRRSRIGTVLNGERIADPRPLHNGDWIRVGRALLLVCDHDPVPTDELRLEGLARAQELDGPAPAAPLDATRVLYSIPAVSRPMSETASAPQLALLEQVSRTLQSVTELEDILTVLLGVAFDVLAPERGAILLCDRADGSPEVAIRHPEDDDSFVSQTLLRHALERRAAIVVRDVGGDERFRGAPSLQAQEVRAAVCCPLISRDQLVGALYLDTRLDGLDARRDEVGLLNLVACFAATAIENAILLRDRSGARGLDDLEPEPLVARSPAMAACVRELEGHAFAATPLLIEGEAGTGKLLAARHVHLTGRGAHAPFLAVDCARMPARDLRVVLFGPERDGDALAPVGAWTDLAGGTLVLEHVDRLDLIAQAAVAARLAEDDPTAPAPRLIATTSDDLHDLAGRAGFHSGLAEQLGRRRVGLPRLRDRREDVLPLARHFLEAAARVHGSGPRELGESAEHTLQAAKYREANVRELRETVELAATLSEGGCIEAEHVFTGPRVRAHRWEFDLGSTAPVAALLRRPVHRGAAVAIAIVFGAIVAACLGWPDHRVGRTANAMVWGLWWPGLLVSFAAVGRAWCSVCPLSWTARRLQALWSLGRRPAAWVKDHARWTMAGLFVAIVWSEHLFSMPHRPFATGWLLVGLLATAVLVALITQREVWCRFACPLGNLSACYSVPATVHVHANPSICQSQCRTHECFKGTREEAGCPMYLHPLYVKDSHFCKLCMSCVRNCPNGSARLWVRPPLQDVWSLGELNPALTPLALTVFLVTPVALAAGSGVAFTGAVPWTIAMLVAALLAWPFARALRNWTSASADSGADARVAVALAVLAWGSLMAFHLGNVPGLAVLSVQAATAGTWAAIWPAAGVPVLATLQVTMIVGALAAALFVLGSIRGHLGPGAPGRRRLAVLVVLAVAHAASAVWMVS